MANKIQVQCCVCREMTDYTMGPECGLPAHPACREKSKGGYYEPSFLASSARHSATRAREATAAESVAYVQAVEMRRQSDSKWAVAFDGLMRRQLLYHLDRAASRGWRFDDRDGFRYIEDEPLWEDLLEASQGRTDG